MRAIVSVTDRGVITLPAKLRKELGLKSADSYVVEEARRNLARKSSGLALEALAKLLTVVEVAPTGTDVTEQTPWLEWLPPTDRPVLAAAAKLRCAVLITGDRTHFESGYGKAFSGVTVLSPAMTANTLLE